MELLGLPSEHTACKVHGELDWESLGFPTSVSQCAQTQSNQVYSCDTSASENDPFQRLQEAGQQGASSNASTVSICCSGVDFLFNMKQAKRDCDVTHCPCDSLFTDSLSPLDSLSNSGDFSTSLAVTGTLALCFHGTGPC